MAHPSGKETRRSFLDVFLGLSLVAWVGSFLYPVIRYLKPLPQAGPTGPRLLSSGEVAKLDRQQFVILLTAGKRVIVFRDAQDTLRAFSAKCTHEGCTVQFLPNESVIWCPCHNARFGMQGQVLSGPPPRPLPRYAVQLRDDGSILVSMEEHAHA